MMKLKGNFRPGDVVVSINGSATQPDKEYAELIVSWNFDPGLIDKFKSYIIIHPNMFSTRDRA